MIRKQMKFLVGYTILVFLRWLGEAVAFCSLTSPSTESAYIVACFWAMHG